MDNKIENFVNTMVSNLQTDVDEGYVENNAGKQNLKDFYQGEAYDNDSYTMGYINAVVDIMEKVNPKMASLFLEKIEKIKL